MFIEVRRSLGLNEDTLKREAVRLVNVAKDNVLNAKKVAIDAEREASHAVDALNEVGQVAVLEALFTLKYRYFLQIVL